MNPVTGWVHETKRVNHRRLATELGRQARPQIESGNEEVRGGSQFAFSLVEVAMAVALATFCLITIMVLLPVGMASNKAAIEQTAAMNVLCAVAADLRATPAIMVTTGTISSRFGIPIPAAYSASATPNSSSAHVYLDASGQPTTASDANVKYLLSGTLMAPGRILISTSYYETTVRPSHYVVTAVIYPSRSATRAHLILNWPAQAFGNNVAGSVETVLLLDRN